MPLNYLDDEQEIFPPPTNWDALRRQQAILTGQPDGADDEGFDSAQQQPSPIAGGMRIPAGNPQPAPQIPLPAPDPVELQRQKAQQARQGVTDLAGKAPVQQKPTGVGGVLRGIAAAGLGAAAGYSNAAGRMRQPIDVSGITNTLVDPGLKRRQAQYQQQMTGAQAKAQAEQQNLTDLEIAQTHTADVAHKQAQSKLASQQADTLAEEGKRSPRGNYVVFGGDGVMDATDGSILRQPTNKAAADYIVIAPDKTKALGLNPTEPDGSTKIPKEGIAPYLAGQMKPDAAARENPNQWIADANSSDPAVASVARKKLKDAAAQAQAARPVNNMNFSIPGLTAPSREQVALTGDEYLKTLPSATANQIRGIAEGRATLPSASTRSQAAQELRQAVFQYDPAFSEQRAQVRKSFTTGPDGRNIGALNTASVHLDQLSEAAKAMQNGTFVPGNEIYNRIRSAFGSSAPTNFAQLKAAVAGEMASALKGQATDQEISVIAQNLQSAGSPQQLADGIETNLHVLGAKLKTYHERYQQQIPGDAVWNPVLPSARSIYAKHGFDPTQAGQQQATGSRGQAPAIHTQAEYNALPRGAEYISPDDGRVHRKP